MKQKLRRKKKDFSRPYYITADELIRYSWAKHHSIEETMKILKDNNFLVNKVSILEIWAELDELIDSI